MNSSKISEDISQSLKQKIDLEFKKSFDDIINLFKKEGVSEEICNNVAREFGFSVKSDSSDIKIVFNITDRAHAIVGRIDKLYPPFKQEIHKTKLCKFTKSKAVGPCWTFSKKRLDDVYKALKKFNVEFTEKDLDVPCFQKTIVPEKSVFEDDESEEQVKEKVKEEEDPEDPEDEEPEEQPKKAVEEPKPGPLVIKKNEYGNLSMNGLIFKKIGPTIFVIGRQKTPKPNETGPFMGISPATQNDVDKLKRPSFVLFERKHLDLLTNPMDKRKLSSILPESFEKSGSGSEEESTGFFE